MEEELIIKKLEHRKIKPTAMRILVLQILLKQKYAINLNDLEVHFKHADRITLYRTLKTFEQHNLIHKIDDGTGAIKYALCADDCNCIVSEQHPHFHCTHCKKTYCMKNIHITAIDSPAKFKIQEINIMTKGLCEDCQ